MTDPTGSPDPYIAVLADLRAQREKIDQAIAVIESLRGVTPRFADGVGVAVGSSTATAVSQPVAPGGAGEFLGMTIADAARKLLASRRRSMATSEIYEEFKRGGLVLTSSEPVNVVGSVLTRRFEKVGDVVRVSRGIWGLQEWYPNRSFKKKNGKPAETANPGEPNAPAQPSEQPRTVPPEIDDLV